MALVLAGPTESLRLCVIRRASRERDRWSGQMALPGGRADPTDPSPRAVAERETLEEVGVDLRTGEYLGPLSELPLYREIPTDAVLSPFAWYLGESTPSLQPEAGEVDDAFWLPMSHLWDTEHVTSVPWTWQGRQFRFPGIAWGDDVIWGLTHRVLSDFAELLGAPLPSAKPIKMT